jgi:hypothetical protein
MSALFNNINFFFVNKFNRAKLKIFTKIISDRDGIIADKYHENVDYVISEWSIPATLKSLGNLSKQVNVITPQQISDCVTVHSSPDSLRMVI